MKKAKIIELLTKANWSRGKLNPNWFHHENEGKISVIYESPDGQMVAIFTQYTVMMCIYNDTAEVVIYCGYNTWIYDNSGHKLCSYSNGANHDIRINIPQGEKDV